MNDSAQSARHHAKIAGDTVVFSKVFDKRTDTSFITALYRTEQPTWTHLKWSKLGDRKAATDHVYQWPHRS
jgi:hypothetical protein